MQHGVSASAAHLFKQPDGKYVETLSVAVMTHFQCQGFVS